MPQTNKQDANQKVQIYIDFEAIADLPERDLPPNYLFKKMVPYAYTIGLMKTGRLHTKTFVVNFRHATLAQVPQMIKNSLIQNIQLLLKNPSQQINAQTITFCGYDPGLENQVIQAVFTNMQVTDIAGGAKIALKRATEYEHPIDHYFLELKKILAQQMPHPSINKRFQSSGALASLAGLLLYIKTHNIKSRYQKLRIKIPQLLKEIHQYSKDDVVRMQWIDEHRQTFLNRAAQWQKIVVMRKGLLKQHRELQAVQKYLDQKMDTMTSLSQLAQLLREDLSACQLALDQKKVLK